MIQTAIVLVSLLTVSGESVQRTPRQELADAQEKWALRKVEHYEFTFRARCFCAPPFLRPVTFRVSDGTSALLTEIGEPEHRLFEQYNSVEKLFEFVRSALDRNAFKLSVEYDPEFGYPRSADVDYRQLTKDEEMSFRVTSFKVLEKR
jgi:hypothetical protein